MSDLIEKAPLDLDGPEDSPQGEDRWPRIKRSATAFLLPDESPTILRVLLAGVSLIAVGKIAEHLHSFVPGLHAARGAIDLLGSMIVGLGEAAVVAWVVAVALENRLHTAFTRKLEKEAGEIALRAQEVATRGVIWRLTFKSAPDVYIRSIKELADEELFTTDARYELFFDYDEASGDNDCVRVTVVNRSFIENRGKRAIEVHPGGWLVSSKVKSSRWVQALYECPGQGFHVDYIRQDLAETRPDPNGYARFVQRDDSPTLFLDPGRFARIELIGEVWRSCSSSLPLFNKRPTLRASLAIRGNAVKDLDFRIVPRGVVPSGVTRGEDIKIRGNSAPEDLEVILDEVFLVGQNIEVIWWKGSHRDPSMK